MKLRIWTGWDLYGGREFLDIDTGENSICTGNTASTKQGYNWAELTVQVQTKKQVRELADRLRWQGWTDLGRK